MTTIYLKKNTLFSVCYIFLDIRGNHQAVYKKYKTEYKAVTECITYLDPGVSSCPKTNTSTIY
jgi:hypothetical protein